MTKHQGMASWIASLTLTVTRGVTAGWIAGIPQVLAAQVAGMLVGERERADIGPRFLHRIARHTGSSLSQPMQWLLGGVFHFEFAAMWGIAYAAIVELLGPRRVPPPVAGGVLGAVIYTAAFSELGAATQTGSERDPDNRRGHEWVVHVTAPLAFALTLSYLYRWLRERW